MLKTKLQYSEDEVERLKQAVTLHETHTERMEKVQHEIVRECRMLKTTVRDLRQKCESYQLREIDLIQKRQEESVEMVGSMMEEREDLPLKSFLGDFRKKCESYKLREQGLLQEARGEMEILANGNRKREDYKPRQRKNTGPIKFIDEDRERGKDWKKITKYEDAKERDGGRMKIREWKRKPDYESSPVHLENRFYSSRKGWRD